jgi:hypothetical protein
VGFSILYSLFSILSRWLLAAALPMRVYTLPLGEKRPQKGKEARRGRASREIKLGD